MKKAKTQAKTKAKAKTKSKTMTKASQANKIRKVVSWTKSDVADLRKHSRSKTPVATISKVMKRTVGALRQKARTLSLPLGHQR